MSLKSKAMQGIKWSGIAQVVKVSLQFAVTAILARLLGPNDFGLIGMANIFIFFATLINDRGPSTALIQNQEANDIHCSTLFWFNIVFSFFLFGLLNILAPLVAVFFEEEVLTDVLRTLSFVFILMAFSIVQRALLTKEMDFKKIAIAENISFIAGGIAGILFALKGYGVYSLVYQLLIQTAFLSALLWQLSSWRPKLLFSIRAFKEMAFFASYVTGNSMLNYVSKNIDYLLIGKFLGAEALGYYTLAFKLMMIPVRNIAWVVSQVLFPAFSKIQENIPKIREHYLIMLKGVALVTFPMMCGLFVLAPEFVLSVAGEKWEPSILVIRILCGAGMLHSIGATFGPVMLSQGRPDLQLKLGLYSTLNLIAFVCIGLRWGIYGVAVFYLLQNILWTPLNSYFASRLVNLELKKLWSQNLRCLLLNIPLVILLVALKKSISINPLGELILFSVLGSLLYLGVLWAKEKKFILENFLSKTS